MADNTPAVTSPDRVPAVAGGKPLNQTQLKNLEKLVMGDFNDLREQVNVEVDNRLSRKLEAVRSQYGDDGALRQARADLVALQRRMQDELEAFLQGLKARGIAPWSHHQEVAGVRAAPETLRLEGLQQAERQLADAAFRLKATASRILAGAERKVLRAVLLQGITDVSAVELINDMPEADDIITLVKAELQTNRDTEGDLELLFGDATPDVDIQDPDDDEDDEVDYR